MIFKSWLLAGAAVAILGQNAMAAPLGRHTLVVGSDNVAVIEPPVAHPSETPCVVQLYKKAQFGASNVNFSYTPPANCPGPYAAIVLSLDISLDAGIQYDRTGTIWIGGVPLWFGTTAEPAPNLGPSWHVERAVTDYASLLAQPNSGFVLIANYTNSTDTSIITSSAQLLFYPATASYPAPVVPDVIIPLAANGGGTVGLSDGTQTVAINQTLPTNIARAALDVYLQGQSGDEFWYTCVPNTLASELENCGGGALREGEVTVDGTPAGVAPVYPWIFTGGIDPFLWTPVPGVQTLDFKPFRVSLSPFAGQLSNGTVAHQIALSVNGANNYFSVAGALMLYLQPGGGQVTGAVTQNTLSAAPSPVVTNNLVTSASGNITGTLNTASQHDFTITGTANLSTGPVTYTVHQTTHFTNDQLYDITPSIYRQLVKQKTNTTVVVATHKAGVTSTETSLLSYPLTVNYVEHVSARGSAAVTTQVAQGYALNQITLSGVSSTTTSLLDNITSADTLLFDAAGNFTGHRGQSSAAAYETGGSTVNCYGHQLASAAGFLTADTVGCAP